MLFDLPDDSPDVIILIRPNIREVRVAFRTEPKQLILEGFNDLTDNGIKMMRMTELPGFCLDLSTFHFDLAVLAEAIAVRLEAEGLVVKREN